MAVTDVLFSGLVSSAAIGSTATGDSITAALKDALGNSGQLNLGLYKEISISVQLETLVAGSSPTLQVIIDSGHTKSDASIYWAHLNGDAPSWTSATNQYRTSAGSGTSHNESIASLGRFIWNIGGGPTSWSFEIRIEGKR